MNKNKKILPIVGIAIAVIAVCLVVFLLPNSDNSNGELSWQEQYDLGVRYLSDGNYEEAIIAFTAAIAIDSKNVAAYISLSDVYMAQGDTDAAKKVLEDALLVCGSDVSIQDRLTQIENTSQGEFATYYTSNLIQPEEMTINGIPFWQAALTDAQLVYPDGTIIPAADIPFPQYDVPFYDITGHKYSCCYIGYNEADEGLKQVCYNSYLQDNVVGFATELRNLCCGQDIDTVLLSLGFTNDAIEAVASWSSVYIGVNSGIISTFKSNGEYTRGTDMNIHFSSSDYSVRLNLRFDTNNILSEISYIAVD